MTESQNLRDGYMGVGRLLTLLSTRSCQFSSLMCSSRFRSFTEQGSAFPVFTQFFAVACVAVDPV